MSRQHGGSLTIVALGIGVCMGLLASPLWHDAPDPQLDALLIAVTVPPYPTLPADLHVTLNTPVPTATPVTTPRPTPTPYPAYPRCPARPGETCEWVVPTATPRPLPVCETPAAGSRCQMPPPTSQALPTPRGMP